MGNLIEEAGESAGEFIGFLSFDRRIGFYTTLAEISGIDRSVIEIILISAKNPRIESKLQNMPAP